MMSSPGEVNAIVHAVLWATVVAYALLFAGVFSRIMPLLSAALVLALLLLRVRDSPLTPTTAALLLGRHVYFDLGANDGGSVLSFLADHPPNGTYHVVLVEATRSSPASCVTCARAPSPRGTRCPARR